MYIPPFFLFIIISFLLAMLYLINKYIKETRLFLKNLKIINDIKQEIEWKTRTAYTFVLSNGSKEDIDKIMTERFFIVEIMFFHYTSPELYSVSILKNKVNSFIETIEKLESISENQKQNIILYLKQIKFSNG